MSIFLLFESAGVLFDGAYYLCVSLNNWFKKVLMPKSTKIEESMPILRPIDIIS